MDPYPYLAKWGISREQFKHDVEHGLDFKEGWKKTPLVGGIKNQMEAIL